MWARRALLVGLALAGQAPCHAVPFADAPYRDASLPIPQRVEDLLAKMTVAEKVAQTLHPWEELDPAGVLKQFNQTGLGSCTSSARSARLIPRCVLCWSPGQCQHHHNN